VKQQCVHGDKLHINCLAKVLDVTLKSPENEAECNKVKVLTGIFTQEIPRFSRDVFDLYGAWSSNEFRFKDEAGKNVSFRIQLELDHRREYFIVSVLPSIRISKLAYHIWIQVKNLLIKNNEFEFQKPHHRASKFVVGRKPFA
jgi:hypothetical protein